MPIDFNGDTLVVTLPDSGGTGALTLDVQNDLYEPWKNWMLSSPKNRRYPPVFRSDGGNPLSAIINQGSYIFLNNMDGWRLKPAEEDGTIYLVGNLAVEDTNLPAFIPTVGGYTTAIIGLQPVTQGVKPIMATQLEYMSFNNCVTLDAINGYPGTGYVGESPIGSQLTPSDNPLDTVVIARARGFRHISVIGDAGIDSGGDYQNMSFIGESPTKSEINISAAANVAGAEFYEAHVTGIMDGDILVSRCLIVDLQYVYGYIEQCFLGGGTIELGGGNRAILLDCWTGDEAQEIDMGGSGQSLVVAGLNGRIKITNKTGAVDTVALFLNSGLVEIDLTTVTAGTIFAWGVGGLSDTLGNCLRSGTYGGVTIVNNLLNTECTAYTIWESLIESGFTAKDVLRIMAAVAAGKLSGAEGTTISIRDINDTKNRVVATVDANGNRTAVTHDVS